MFQFALSCFQSSFSYFQSAFRVFTLPFHVSVCSFVSSDPPDSIYWIRTRDGELEKVGDCGENKRFDDSMCECLGE